MNLAARFDEDELAAHLDICARYVVEIIISVQGNPRALTERVHDWGGRVFHDVTSFRFAEKAIAAIRAAEILGADLSYLGTPFIGTQESLAHADYKALLVSESSEGLMYTGRIAGVPANWLTESMRSVGLDPDDLPVPTRAGMSHEHLPDGVNPWANLWSAGQGIELIEDIPSVADLAVRLRREHVEACRVPDMAEVARLVEGAAPPVSEPANDAL